MCAFQSARWHSREQYRTASHRAHTLLASSDAHPAAAHPARATPPTNAAAPAAADTACPLPAGTRVLVQRLVAKPEHNGKRARVVSFDARTGRYAVALDDGKELSLKAERGAQRWDARRRRRAA